MGKYLFTSQPAMGHLNPLITIAKHMEEKGHSCVFAVSGPPGIAEKVRGHGFETLKLGNAPASLGLMLLPFTSGFFETCFALRMFFAGLPFYARKLVKIIDREKPDGIVTDFGFPAGCLAGEKMDIPCASVYSAGLFYKGPGIPAPGSGLPIGEDLGARGESFFRRFRKVEKKIDKVVNRARRKLGLPEGGQGILSWLASPWLTLILTAEACEAPRDELPATGYFIGPCFGKRDAKQASDFPFDSFADDKPKVYISLGTVFNKKPKAFQRIIDGFPEQDCQLIVSAGRAYRKLKARGCPENVLLFERVPQIEVLKRVDAVISHGGNNTTNETLAAGKPLLVMPVGGEQGDNAARVVYLGAGLRADLKRSGSKEIGDKVRRLINEESFKNKAQEMAAELAKTQGAETAIRLIEHMATDKAKLVRPEKYPMTITADTPMPWEF